MDRTEYCGCSELNDVVVVGMGHPGDLDGRILATLDPVRDHGGDAWWLHASTCSRCGQHWMIAQESRIHDNYCLRRLSAAEMGAIVEQSHWPVDFLRFEQVLRLEREAGQTAHFLDPRSPALVDTAKDLRRPRPDISIEDIAHVLAIPVGNARRLLRPKWRLFGRRPGGR